MVYEPELMLMDEPFSALDVQTRDLIETDVLRVWEELSNQSIVFVTHDLEEAIAMSDRVIVLTRGPGRIKADYTIDLPRGRDVREIRSDPRFIEIYQKIWGDLRVEVLAAQDRQMDDRALRLNARTRTKLLAWAAAAVTIVLLLLWWQGIDARTANFLSRPVDVIKDLGNWATSPDLRADIGVTLAEAIVGLIVAAIAAIVLAAILNTSRLLADVAEPFIAATNSIPKLALAPLFILVFGIGFSAKVNFVVVSVFFIPFYALFFALRTVDPTIRAHVRILGAGRLHLIRDLYIPAVIGSLTASMRSALAFALVTAVIAELIAATAGIGYQISSAGQNGQPARMLSGVLVIGILGFVLDRLLLLVERPFSRWRVAGQRTT